MSIASTTYCVAPSNKLNMFVNPVMYIFSPAFTKKYCGGVFYACCINYIIPICTFRPSYRTSPMLNVCMCVCMYGHHIQQSMDQPDEVANPARGQLKRENEHFSVPV